MDDEPVVRALVPSMLEGDGVEVVAIGDGARAVAEARRLRPDLVLLDILLPGLDGLSVLRLLRADRDLAGTPVHMLTSRAGDQEAAAKAGANGYIQKPFRAAALLALVASLRSL